VHPPVLHARLLAWYDRAGRRLSWRAPPGVRPDPWVVLVSETMLQQTTVATVAARFAPFLARFPDPASLAAASQDEVLHAWQGLGYYRRARALHALARHLVAHRGGRLPEDRDGLLELPGIGPYTADALLAIAFGRPALPLDANVQRVLARLHAIETPLPAALGELRALARGLVPTERPGDVAQALMDLGSLVCTPARSDCAACPLAFACRARAAGIAATLPRRRERPVRPLRHGIAFLLRRADGAILFRRRPAEGLLGGMVELPTSPWQGAPPSLAEALAHAPARARWALRQGVVRHVFTHLTLDLALALGTADAAQDGLWCAEAELHRLALPTLTRKLLAHGGVAPPPAIRAGALSGRGRDAS
jgi:A/G-specific adenine glycosylase